MTNKYNTVLYTGLSNNIVRRVYIHKNKLAVKGFTTRYNVNKLVYYEVLQDPKNMIKREKAIKNLKRDKKIELINKKNPEWRDLYENLLK